MTPKQQQKTIQNSSLSSHEQWALLNASPQYVETIAKVQDLFAKRYVLGLTTTDARGLANKLFTIADERDQAINRTGKFANDAIFAPKALRWLDEQEEELFSGLGKDKNDTSLDRLYNGSNPDIAARALRRSSYADIDDASASKQIEKLIMDNVSKAKKHASLSEPDGSGLAATSAQMLWFYQNVKAGAPMDYKNEINWNKTLPRLPYPEEDKVYNVFGYDISSSDLGNLNYGLVGKALGIPETLLLQQAGAAAMRDHYHYKFIGSQLESLRKKDYGDQGDDQEMIKNGFSVYNLLY